MRYELKWEPKLATGKHCVIDRMGKDAGFKDLCNATLRFVLW